MRSELPTHRPLPIAVALLLVASPAAASPGGTASPVATSEPGLCRLAGAGDPRVEPGPTRVQMRPTRRAAAASGTLALAFPDSPYGVTLAEDGSYLYRLRVTVDGLRQRGDRVHVAWVATPDLERHRKLGVVGPQSPAEGRVLWNKFLVFVTAEPSADVAEWSQEILLTARSPSSWMHSMAGHGPFSSEPCVYPRG